MEMYEQSQGITVKDLSQESERELKMAAGRKCFDCFDVNRLENWSHLVEKHFSLTPRYTYAEMSTVNLWVKPDPFDFGAIHAPLPAKLTLHVSWAECSSKFND